jgi:hypothetical protein
VNHCRFCLLEFLTLVIHRPPFQINAALWWTTLIHGNTKILTFFSTELANANTVVGSSCADCRLLLSSKSDSLHGDIPTAVLLLLAHVE